MAKYKCGVCGCKVRVAVDATGMFLRPKGEAYALTTIADVVAFACGDTCAQAFASELAEAQEMKATTMNAMKPEDFAPSLEQVAREASGPGAPALYIHLDDTLKLPREVTNTTGTGWCGMKYTPSGRWELIGPAEVRRMRAMAAGDRVNPWPVQPEGEPILGGDESTDRAIHRAAFIHLHGMTPEAWLAKYRAGELADNMENNHIRGEATEISEEVEPEPPVKLLKRKAAAS